MMLPTEVQLKTLAREELIAVATDLLTMVKLLQARVTELEARLAKLRQPPATSRNSSAPPSGDWKADLPGRRRKKRGPPFGHERAVREWVDDPDQVIEAPVTRCSRCQADLSGVVPRTIVRRQLTELPEIRPLVIETHQHEVVCPHCQHLERGALPEGLEAERAFGPRLEATVVYLKHEQHLSYERTAVALNDLFGVELSEGGIGCILQRAGEAAQLTAEEIKQAVVESRVIGSDETLARVTGKNWWHWVFTGASGTYHTIAPTRSAQVIEQVMGEHEAGCWVSDCYGPQLQAPAQNRQVCLAHQLRDLQRCSQVHLRLRWAVEMQVLLREAIHLGHRREALTPVGYQRRVAELENRLDAWLKRRLTGEMAVRLQKRFVKHRDHLLTFLYNPDVPAANNTCERALRPSVIHRKVTNGFHSEWGARTYAALQTVLSTARQQGHRVFSTLVELMGKPVLHFLVPLPP
jgi:transposase